MTTKPNPLTARCARCSWARTGRTAAMLAAQRKHRQVHAPNETKGRPA